MCAWWIANSTLPNWSILRLLILFYFILFGNVLFRILLHDYTLYFTGSPCRNVRYYNYNSIWPYYIDIHLFSPFLLISMFNKMHCVRLSILTVLWIFTSGYVVSNLAVLQLSCKECQSGYLSLCITYCYIVIWLLSFEACVTSPDVVRMSGGSYIFSVKYLQTYLYTRMTGCLLHVLWQLRCD